MVADQRHYLAPLPEPQESERSAVLTLLAQRLASTAVSSGLEKELLTLSEMELKSTGSWALVPGAQAEWITTAIRYLESASERLPPAERPDPYFAEDVVAGVIASVRAVIASTNSTPHRSALLRRRQAHARGGAGVAGPAISSKNRPKTLIPSHN